jgi:hypothetical protein
VKRGKKSGRSKEENMGYVQKRVGNGEGRGTYVTQVRGNDCTFYNLHYKLYTIGYTLFTVPTSGAGVD